MHNAAKLKKQGFKKYTPSPTFSAYSLDANSKQKQLPFPIDLKFEVDQFGAVMHQFQDWTSPAYFHAGIDIRGELNQEVFSPVFGKIEAGYYSYTDSFDGRSEKYFLSYNDVIQGKGSPPWGELYFEVAVTDPDGYRFEFHHIDAKALPDTIVEKILSGGTVAPGEFLGVLVDWPRTLFGHVYHHLHYNVVGPDGAYINPFTVSDPIPDSIPPEIVNVYSTKQTVCGSQSPRLTPLNESFAGVLQDDTIVIETFDQIQLGKARQVPTVIRADFVNAPSFSWDFSTRLETDTGERPNITKMYLYYLCDEKNWLQVATKNFRFYIKIPVPKNYSGPVTITSKDEVGNSTIKKVVIRSR